MFANPQGMSVAAGNATATAKGPNLDIRTASRNTFLNWQSFNIAPGETTTFRQPSASSIVWNRINDPNPSQILGHLRLANSINGGARGGNGRWMEISAPSMAEILSSVNGSTASGFRGGSLLIDPTDINIGPTTRTGTYDSGTSAGTGPATLNLNFNSAFVGLSTIALQATHNITIRAATGGGATTWDLVGSTGVSTPGSTLSLESGNDIILQNNVTCGRARVGRCRSKQGGIFPAPTELFQAFAALWRGKPGTLR